MTIKDDYPGVTEFGAFPSEVSIETIERIESEATNLRAIHRIRLISMMDHPTLGTVLVLDRDDGTGGFVMADGVRFV